MIRKNKTDFYSMSKGGTGSKMLKNQPQRTQTYKQHLQGIPNVNNYDQTGDLQGIISYNALLQLINRSLQLHKM